MPTDFSKNGLNGIRYAMELQNTVDCDFYFLNVFHADGYTLDNMMMPEPGEHACEEAKVESKEGLENLLEQLKLHPDNPKHSYQTISTFNALSEAVKYTKAKKDIDIVVMGTKGKTGSKTVFFWYQYPKRYGIIDRMPRTRRTEKCTVFTSEGNRLSKGLQDSF